MLVLSRKLGEKLVIDGDIVITVVEIDTNRVRLGIDAPKTTRIYRSELLKETPCKLSPSSTPPVIE